MSTLTTYCSPAEYLDQFGASEATMLLQDEQRTLEQSWLEALIGNDQATLATLDASQLAVVDGALTRLNRALIESANLINGYLRSAGLALPLSADQIAQTPIKTCNAELARCWLMDDSDNATDLSEKRCEQQRAWLRDISMRRVALLPTQNDAQPNGVTEVRSGRSASRFDTDWSGYPL